MSYKKSDPRNLYFGIDIVIPLEFISVKFVTCIFYINWAIGCAVPKIKGCHYVPPDNAQLLAASLVQNGPHAVALDASKISFRLYKEGIYYDPECSTERLSHVMGCKDFYWE